MRQANEYLRMGARAYCLLNGMDEPIEGHWSPVSRSEAEEIARLYDALPDAEPHAGAAYGALAREIDKQYLFATGLMGIRCEPTTDDPYPDSAAMIADVRDNKRLKVYAGETAHPFLSHDQQVRFRFIHDLFGHAAEGYSFGPRGEQNAWIHHSMMFTPLARRALTTETRGQNSWVNYGPHSHLPVTERPFAPQKAALLPAWVSDWVRAFDNNEED